MLRAMPKAPNGALLAWLRDAVANRDRTTGCWDWPFSCSGQYGQVYWCGRKRKAAHVALELDGRPRPNPQALSLHSCDRQICVNPSHLRWGTHQDNTDDMLARGRERYLRGEKHRWAKLSPSDVAEIRRRYRSDQVTQRQLAHEYDMSQTAIGQLIRGQTWSETA